MSDATAILNPPTRPDTPRRDVPAIVFRATSFAMAVFVLTGPGGASYLPAPWRVVGEPDPSISFELHRWHVTDITALVALLLVGALLACALAPRRSLPAAQSFLGTVTLLAVAAPFTRDPAMILVPCVTLATLFVATYPERRQLSRVSAATGRNLAARAAAVVATPYLLYDITRNLRTQLVDTSQHGELGHWAIGVALSASLLLAGWLAARGGNASRGLNATLGVTYGYLGVAALTIPHHDGSWSIPGGVIALVVAAAFVLAAARRRDPCAPSTP
jgi:hypothetical protein